VERESGLIKLKLSLSLRVKNVQTIPFYIKNINMISTTFLNTSISDFVARSQKVLEHDNMNTIRNFEPGKFFSTLVIEIEIYYNV
jgi:polyhydroxyalkanoate synthesis regulator protein